MDLTPSIPFILTNEARLIPIDIGKLADPIGKLIDRCANGLGVLYEPTRKIREAKAEVRSAVILAEGNAVTLEIAQRTAHRLQIQEEKYQGNIEAAIAGALPYLKPDARPSDIEEEWLLHFGERAKLASSNQAQRLWSRVLSQEANMPGDIGKRALDILSLLSVDEAELFQKLCCALWNDEEQPILPASLADRWGLNLLKLTDLSATGLITNHDTPLWHEISIAAFEQTFGDKKIRIESGLEFDPFGRLVSPGKAWISSGNVLFTKEGRQLVKIVERSYPPEAFEEALKMWARDGLVVYSPLPFNELSS